MDFPFYMLNGTSRPLPKTELLRLRIGDGRADCTVTAIEVIVNLCLSYKLLVSSVHWAHIKGVLRIPVFPPTLIV